MGAASRPPSFKGLKPSSQLASRTLARVKAKETSCERILRSALWQRGLRYRKNVESLPGRPDIVFPRMKVAVFCDGDFWHGRKWSARKKKLEQGSNSKYWVSKISHNMKRDKANRLKLRRIGWKVLRLWESEILRNTEMAAKKVTELLDANPPKKSPPG